MFTVSGGGNVFTGSKTVSLSGSQTGTAYQLLLDGANSGASVNGTGSTLQWTVTQVGTFTVRASVGFCSVVMTGNAITVNRDIRQILQVDSAQAVHIPEKVKTFAFGWVPVASA
ncbi:MAG TPA: hypothetical protein DCE81_01285, partial [Cytophagales bacterium]|nr:hypothetical protein [Cytophagales bacterium]